MWRDKLVVYLTMVTCKMAFFFRTVDNGIKLSSLVSIPDVTDVPAMNKITSNKLNRLVTHEDTPKASQPILGHLLSQIFQSFTIPLPDVSDLKIPFGKILHHNQRIDENFSSTSPDTLVPLYDTEAKTWNWALPVDPPENGSNPAGVDSGSDSEDNATQETTHEENFAAFLNAFASCLSRSRSELVAMRFATGTWSAANAQKAVPSSASQILSYLTIYLPSGETSGYQRNSRTVDTSLRCDSGRPRIPMPIL